MFDIKGGGDPAFATTPSIPAAPPGATNSSSAPEAKEEIFVSVRKIKQLNNKLSFRYNYAHFQETYQFLQNLREKVDSSGELLPDLEIFVNYEGQVQPQRLYTINIEKILHESKSGLGFDPNKTLFNLDVARILTGIARLFHQVDPNLIPEYTAEDQLDLVLLKTWLQPETVEKTADAFDEVYFVRNKIHELKKLIEAVLRAAEIYKEKHAPTDLSRFVTSEEMRNKLYAVFAEELIQLLPNYELVDWKNQTQARSELLLAIIKLLSDQDLFTEFFQSLLPELNNLQLHDPVLGRFDPGLLEKEWFSRSEQQNRREALRNTFIGRHGKQLADTHINPLLNKTKARDATESIPAAEAGDDVGGADSQEQQAISQVLSSDFHTVLQNAAVESLTHQLVVAISNDYEAVRLFAEAHPELLDALLISELPKHLGHTAVFGEFITEHFAELLNKYGGFFQGNTNPETNTIEYTISVGLLQQPELQTFIAEYVAEQLPATRSRVEPTLLAFVTARSRTPARTTTQEQALSDENEPISTSVVATVPTSTTTPVRSTLDAEAQSKLFLATQQLLANTLLFPIANNLNTTIDQIDAEIHEELRIAANRFLLEQQKDLRLTASERLKLIQAFQRYLLSTYVSTSARGQKIVQLFSNNEVVVLYVAFDTDLKRIAQFDTLASTVILKQKIDAFILEADEKALSIVKALDLSNAGDLRKFFQIIQLPDDLDVTRELTTLVRDHPQVINVFINYIAARIPELDAAIHTRQQRKPSAPTSEKAVLFKTEQTAQVHRLVQAVSSSQRFQGDGSEAEIVGSALGRSKRENLLDKANWLLKQNEDQFGFVWRNLTIEQQRAVYEELARKTGSPPLIPGDFVFGVDGLPMPPDIALANIPQIIQQLKVGRTRQELDGLQAILDQIEQSKNNEEYLQLQYADNLGSLIVTSFLNELPPELLAKIGAIHSMEREALANLLSYEEILESAQIAEEQLLSETPTPSGISNFLRRKKTSAIDGSTQAASKKTFSKAEDLAYKAGKIALSTSGVGAVAAKAINLLEKTFGEENTKKLIKYGGAFGVGATALATILQFLTSAWARWGGAAGSLIGGAVGSFFPAVGTALGAASGLVAGTFIGFAAEQIKNGLLAGGATTPPPAAGQFVPPKHAVQPRFAPRQLPSTEAIAQSAGTQGAQTTGARTASTQAMRASNTTLSSGTATAATAAAKLSLLPVAILAPALVAILITVLGFITVFIIFSAFLIPLPGGGGYTQPPLAGFEGCWPTTGTISVLRKYDTGISHAVWRSVLNATTDASGGTQNYQPPASAIDISFNKIGQPPKIYAPFSGFASFYPWGTGKSTLYGNHIVITTPTFAIILAHLADFNGEEVNGVVYKSVVAGQELGTMGNTGNSRGTHLHYEVIGGGIDILDVLPISPIDRARYNSNETDIWGLPVSATDCAIPGEGQGYLAIGPATASNIQVSSTAEINQPPTTSCSWQSRKGMTVATNANFYNTPYVPIGFAGSSPVNYFANADDRSIDFADQLHSLIVRNSGTVEMIRPDPDKIYRSAVAFPVPVSGLQKAVTGIYAEGGSSDATLRERTAVGLGVSNGLCETQYVGQKVVFLAVMPEASFDMIERALGRCGAQQITHMDGGSSSTFCSSTLSFDRNKPVAAHVGLQEAVITRIGGGAGVILPSPTPPTQ